MEKLLYEGAVEKLELIFNERIKRFNQLVGKMEKSIELYKSIKGIEVSNDLINQKRELFENIQEIEKGFNECLSYSGDEELKAEFLNNLDLKNKDFISEIQNLSEEIKKVGTSWLLSIVENTKNVILNYLPSFI